MKVGALWFFRIREFWHTPSRRSSSILAAAPVRGAYCWRGLPRNKIRDMSPFQGRWRLFANLDFSWILNTLPFRGAGASLPILIFPGFWTPYLFFMLTKHRLGKRPFGVMHCCTAKRWATTLVSCFLSVIFFGTRVTFKEVPHKELYDKRCTTAFELIPYQ